jgi:hypothetical protein
MPTVTQSRVLEMAEGAFALDGEPELVGNAGIPDRADEALHVTIFVKVEFVRQREKPFVAGGNRPGGRQLFLLPVLQAGGNRHPQPTRWPASPRHPR